MSTLQDTKSARQDGFSLRLLTPDDRQALAAHLLNLDTEGRRARFGGAVNDGFLVGYAERVNFANTALVGSFVDGTLRGVCELRSLSVAWAAEAEIALSVDKSCRGRAVGSLLMQSTLELARRKGLDDVYLYICPSNLPMRRLAQKFATAMECGLDEVIARVTLATAASRC